MNIEAQNAKLLKTDDFDYFLPDELIAQTPIEPRDSSRLMAYNSDTGETEHRLFNQLPSLLRAGDLLVLNNTRVYPARIYARTKFGGHVEILLLKRLNLTDWEILVKPGRKALINTVLDISEELSAKIIARTASGERVARFIFKGIFEEILSRTGEMPLPPYIRKRLEDRERYQTVYCKNEGSSAAPTAGLHFTNRLMNELKTAGIQFAEIDLNVGLGTFRPVRTEDLTKHEMHSEHYVIDKKDAEIINAAKREKRRIIAVGTTSVRTLESACDEGGFVKPISADTQIFIYPPYRFKCVDGLITNFHLPKSTLIMLVSAFAGREKTLELYNTAVENKYRFFSFGDAMLIT